MSRSDTTRTPPAHHSAPRANVLVATALIATTLLTAACSATTYDSSLATTEPAPLVSTTVPSGSVAELLPVMLEEVRTLSEKVAANRGDTASVTLIEQLWSAMANEVLSTYPDSVEDFEFVVRRCRAAADRSRPADADRAHRNLQSLADAIL